MKELSIEEKAQRYDRAIEQAMEWYNDRYIGIGFKANMERLFPELKESEDEKIRKALIWHLTKIDNETPLGAYHRIDGIEISDMIAWLEKQGEKKSVDDLTQQEAMDIAVAKCFKEGEQESADKIEPKFKVGDWIVSNEHSNCVNSLMRIVEVGLTDYLCGYYNGQTTYCHEFIDKSYHLWTIQDAKDGDVLSWDDSKCISLFKNIYDKDFFNSYGFVGHYTGTFELRQSYHDIKGAHPATKKQCDLLFQKMKEAGYEWDAEKKELKKIEQKPAEWTQDNIKELTDFEIAMMHIGESFFGKYHGLNPNDTEVVKEQAKFLMELIQKPAWSEEDETGLTNTIIMLKEGASLHFNKKDITKAINWLKSLKDRFIPQVSKEWSEEDVNNLNRIAVILNEAYQVRNWWETERIITKLEAIKLTNFLKSLRPQNTWKPSDEQMTQLKKYCPDNRPLTSLYEQLKKLRGE